MATKIVLNKKNSKDEFGILTIQSFKNNSKTKKSIGIKVSVEDFNNHFNKDFKLFTGQTPTEFFKFSSFW